MRDAARRGVVGPALIVLVLSGTAPASAAIYGVDDRLEPYQAEAPWLALAEDAVVLMLDPTSFDLCGGVVALTADVPTVGVEQMLCPGQPFADQPSLARCSATLVEPDVVATAAHCVEDDSLCPTTLFARAPRFTAPGALWLPGPMQVASCRRVLARGQGVDVVLIQLDHPIGPAGAPLAPGLPGIGETIGAIGFPSGMPAKVSTCTVQARVGDLTRHGCDLFRGSSGSGTFDSAGRLFGVHSQGPGDYRPEGACRVPTVYAEDGTLPGVTDVPQFGAAAPIGPVVDALCATGWPGAVCGRRTTCGDGTCAGGETEFSCADDCPAASCGDGVCQWETEATTCATDCTFIGCIAPPPADGAPNPDASPGPGADDPGDGGCASGRGTGAGSVLLLLGWVAARTRRPGRCRVHHRR